MTTLRRQILLPLVPMVAVSLLAAAASLEATARGDLSAALDQRLLVLVQGLASSLELGAGGETELELGGASARELRSAVSEGFYLITDARGAVVAAGGRRPPESFSPTGPGPTFRSTASGGRPLRACALAVVRGPGLEEEARRAWRADHPGEALPKPKATTFHVVAGLPSSSVDRAVRVLRKRLLAVFLPLFAILVAGPAWAVERALGPLRRVSREAGAIGPETSGVRLSENAPYREVAQLVAALNGALERLGEAYERQRRFTSDVAHELRTPVTALRTECEVALRHPTGPEDLRESLEAAHRSALRLGALVEDFLTLARMDRFALSGRRESSDLARAAREAAKARQGLASEKGIVLATELPGPLPVRGDQGLLTECLVCLVDNAIRYTEPGGRIRLTGGLDGGPWLAVEDTGRGIGEEHLSRIFDRFYRVEASRARGEGGTGLGLAIAREIARLHGGDVSVESEVGRGSRFTLRLPAPS